MKTIIIDNIRIPVEQAHKEGLAECVETSIRARLGTSGFEYTGMIKKSIDARRRNKIVHVVSASADVDESFDIEKIRNCRFQKEYKYEVPDRGSRRIEHPPVIAGSGPCGLFCAYVLAKNGYRPVVLERGDDIDRRHESVRNFWRTGNLDLNSNVQFGEGGAGTYSDGKLVTRINDPRCREVLNIFLNHGAPEDISYEAKPHIGTDCLMSVIKGIRGEIESLGGRFMFRSELTGIDGDGTVSSVRVNDEFDMAAEVLVLAIGHSARDTYEMLFDKGLSMEQKPFSAGVRIEHLQDDVNQSQWGKQFRFIGTAADYSLSIRKENRAAYTFCMCPGGVVVNASSEKDRLTVNGMSYRSRNGRNANSAWVAEVRPSDLESGHPLAGVEFQRKIEERAFAAGGGGYAAPVQLLGEFLGDSVSIGFGKVRPSFTGDTEFADLNDILPSFLSKTLKASVGDFSQKLGCFAFTDSVLTGCETRTSAPLRIRRNEFHVSKSMDGVYPAGEGAGYAGGIMSAATDGMKVAESIIKMYNYTG